jgi:N-acetylneuraminate synthase
MFFNKNINQFTINQNQTISEFYEKQDASKDKFFCVVDDDRKLLGVISLGDLSKLSLKITDHSNLVSSIMNKNFSSLKHGTSMSIMMHHLEKYRFVPIINEFNELQMLAQGDPKKREFHLGEHSIQYQEDYILIAEIGNNHNGSVDHAFELIRSAKESGAHIAKFQMRELSSLYGDTESSEDLSTEYVINLLKKVSLSCKDMYKCFDYCREIGITPLCTPFDLTSLNNLEKYGIEGYKVASADLTNHELLEALIKTKKPLIISTGMSTDEDIDHAISLLESNYTNYALCHANSTYPAPFKDIHLNYIDNLKARTTSVIGYSGHERGWHIPIAAFTKGAQVIEKHFTLDKSLEGNDHKVSLLPAEFSQLSKALDDLSKSLGIGHMRQVTQGEASNKIALSKSLFSKKDINQGSIITEQDIIIRSPGIGLSPRNKEALISRIAHRNIKKGDAFYQSDLEDQVSNVDYETPRNYKWSIPVRHRDVYKLYDLFNPPAIEFHLSFKDLEIIDEKIITRPLDSEVIVHSPEQFDGDFIIDLFSDNKNITNKTIDLLNQIFTKAKKIGQLIGYKNSPKVVVNCGGHSIDEFLSEEEVENRINNFSQNVKKVNTNGCRFLAQTMPPYPWHFGGQGFHNQFTSAANILKILSVTKQNVELCLDISHSYMWCNYSKNDLSEFIAKIASKVSHIHISDAMGESEEGLQIGEGSLDFEEILEAMSSIPKNTTLLPEIWQGHDNFGKGFKIALDRLHKLGY